MTAPLLWLAGLLAAVAVLTWPSARQPRRRRPWPRAPGVDGVDGLTRPPLATAPSPARPVRLLGRPRSGAAGASTLPVPVVPVPVVVELVAAALSAGLPTADALAAAVRAAGPSAASLSPVVAALRLGVPVERAWARAGPAYASLGLALVLADRTGASAAAALRRTAADERAGRRRRAQVAARRLGVQLVVPLGLATLPSFALLAVVPVLLGLATRLLSA